MTRHYQQHRFEPREPPIDDAYSMEEAMAILKAPTGDPLVPSLHTMFLPRIVSLY
jgi:hypothetical protein